MKTEKEKPKMEVLIDNRQSNHKISVKMIHQTAQVILNALDCPDAEISIVIVDDLQMAEFNRNYLNREGPTNVIAFPMQEGEFSEINPYLLGDVVISADTAHKEGKAADIDLPSRFTQLLVHGILHLVGYDHENDEQEAQKMETKNSEILHILEN